MMNTPAPCVARQMISPTVNPRNWFRLYHSLRRSIQAFLWYVPGSTSFPAGQRLSVPELYSVAWRAYMLDPAVDVIPQQQPNESLQGYLKRLLTNRLPSKEGVAMVYTYAACLFHGSTCPPSDANLMFFDYFCHTLAEVILRTLPQTAQDLMINEQV